MANIEGRGSMDEFNIDESVSSDGDVERPQLWQSEDNVVHGERLHEGCTTLQTVSPSMVSKSARSWYGGVATRGRHMRDSSGLGELGPECCCVSVDVPNMIGRWRRLGE